MTSPKPWRVLAQKTLLVRRWLTVVEESVELPNGHRLEEFHRIQAPDWACVLALTPDLDAVLVRQYRHGIAGPSLELPAGVIEDQEAGLAAAQRELREETGYVADAWHPLSVVSTEPARHTTRAHVFVALGARSAFPQALDPGEVLSVERRPARELRDLIASGDLHHAVHVAAVLLAAERGFLTPPRP